MLRRGPTECSKAMTSQSYYENRISDIRNIWDASRGNFLPGAWRDPVDFCAEFRVVICYAASRETSPSD
jgi:hypothetical protein